MKWRLASLWPRTLRIVPELHRQRQRRAAIGELDLAPIWGRAG
ncbi:MAG: hypothetical protein ACYCZL_12950 [Polaromonas sp.]